MHTSSSSSSSQVRVLLHFGGSWPLIGVSLMSPVRAARDDMLQLRVHKAGVFPATDLLFLQVHR
jgi:hypothetical protein